MEVRTREEREREREKESEEYLTVVSAYVWQERRRGEVR